MKAGYVHFDAWFVLKCLSTDWVPSLIFQFHVHVWIAVDNLQWSLMNMVLMLGMLGKNCSRQDFETFFLFSRKQTFILHINCLLRWQYTWNVEISFVGKSKKNVINLASTEFSQGVIKVKNHWSCTKFGTSLAWVMRNYVCIFMPLPLSGEGLMVLHSIICPCVCPSHFIEMFVSLQLLLQFWS